MKPKFLLLFIAVALSAILFWRYYSEQPDAPTVDPAPPADADTDQLPLLPPLATATDHNFTPEAGQVSVQLDKTDLNSVAYSSSQAKEVTDFATIKTISCLLYTSPSPRDRTRSRMPSSA